MSARAPAVAPLSMGQALPPPAHEFLDELRTQRRVSRHTLAAYEHDLRVLSRLAGESEFHKLQPADIRRFAARLHGQGLAPASIARTLSAWRSFFRWHTLRKRGGVNPVAGVRAPRRGARLPKALAPDDAVRLVAHETDGSALQLRDRAIVELFYSSGLRLSELVDLDWRFFDIDPSASRSRGWIDLNSAEATVTGKGDKRRTVPIGKAAVQALRDWLTARARLATERADADPRALFLSERGRRIARRSVAQRLAQLARRLDFGQHVHPHMLRHSMASHLLQSSGDLRAVQELLGHASIAATQIYTRLDWQHLARAYDVAHPRARRKLK